MSYHEKSPTELLEPMNVDPDQPSRVDIAAAMRTGRRRKRFTITGAGAAIAALVGGVAIGGNLAFGGPGPAPVRLPNCVGTPLPVDSYEAVDVTGADPTGRWVAGRTDTPGQASAVVVWHDDKIVEVLRKPGVVLDDLTSTGVGVATANGGRTYVYQDGRLTALKGDRASAVRINENGVIAGTAGGRPVRWASATADPEPLPLPAGVSTGWIQDLSEDGTIVGQIPDRTGRSAYLWLPDGTRRAIPAPRDGDREATRYRPEQIRDGWVYGKAEVRTVISVAPSDGSSAGTLSDGVNEAPFRHEITTGRSERLALPADLTQPYLHLGNQLVILPKNPGGPGSYTTIAVGADGLSAAGRANPGTFDAARPMSWRCK